SHPKAQLAQRMCATLLGRWLGPVPPYGCQSNADSQRRVLRPTRLPGSAIPEEEHQQPVAAPRARQASAIRAGDNVVILRRNVHLARVWTLSKLMTQSLGTR